MFNVSKETKKIGNVIVLNAEGGVGKSSIMGAAVLERGDKGVVISLGEDGITPLKNSNSFVDLTGINHIDTVITKWAVTPKEKETAAASGEEPEPGFLELLHWLAKQDYNCIGFDSITKLMPVLKEYCLQVYFFDQPELHGKNSSGGLKNETELTLKAEGFGGAELIARMSQEWNRFIAALNFFRDGGKDVYITAHRATKKGRIVGESLDYDFNFINMPMNKDYDLGTDLYDVVDAFLYGKFDITIASGKGNKGRAVGSNERILVTEGTASIKAKNRFSMPEQIPATYEELKKYL